MPAESGASLVVRGIGALVTNGGRAGDLLGVIADAAVIVRDGLITWCGRERDMPPTPIDSPVIDVDGRAVVPGFVDAHTHLVFGGDRAAEFGRRLAGEPYEEILAAGGGIRSTVTATRAATSDALFEAAVARARRMLAAGTTTVEVKSGYGLEVATEVRILETIRRVGEALPIDVVPTFLGAHVIGPEYSSDREGYVRLIVDEMLPTCAPLADFCDVFCDVGAFTVPEARLILESARRHHLGLRLHAEQLGRTGGARLAAEMGAASADHLDHADAGDRAALRAAGTAAVVLPGVTLSMRLPPPPAREMWDEGLTVAIATDCNPGTAYVETMPFMIALACLEMGLTPDEALWSATRGGAMALRRDDLGRLTPGDAADMVVLDAPSHVHLVYRPDTPLVHTVIKGGKLAPVRFPLPASG